MGFFTPTETPAPLGSVGFDFSDPEREGASLSEVIGSAFRTDNMVGASIVAPPHVGEFDPEFNLWETTQEYGVGDHYEAFVGARNLKDFEGMYEAFRREMRDRTILQDAGGVGFAASMAAAVFDLPTLIPGGAVVSGGTRLGNAARVGAAAGFGAAVAEGGLQAAQALRTPEESIFAISGSMVLGAAIGAALGRVGKEAPREFTAAAKQIEEAPVAISESINAMRAGNANFELLNEGRFQWMRRLGLGILTRSDPLIRTQLRPFQSFREIAAKLAESPLAYEVNRSGDTVGVGASVEQAAKREVEENLLAMDRVVVQGYADYFKDGPVGFFGRQTAPYSARYQHLVGRREKLLEHEFFEEVSRAMRSGDTHPLAAVDAVANKLRPFYDKVYDRLAAADLFEELEYTPKYAKSYLQRVFLKEKITRHRNDGSVDDMAVLLRRHFMENQEETLARAEARGTEFGKLNAELKGLKRQMNRERLGNVSAKQVRTENRNIRIRVDEIEKRLAEMKKEGKESGLAWMSEGEVEEIVQDTIDSILSLKPGEHSMAASLTKPMRARVLDVPDELLSPWLEKNIRTLNEVNMRGVMPRLNLYEKFGDWDMKLALDDARRELAKLTREAKTEKERVRLEREFRLAVTDVEGMRDRILGHYGVPKNPEGIAARAADIAKTASYTQLLGGVVASSIPDISRLLARAGLRGFGEGITQFALAPAKFIKSAREMAEFKAAADWVLNSRMAALSDITDRYHTGSRFERGFKSFGRGFSRLSGIAAWNTTLKSISGVLVMSRLLKAAEAVRAGKATQKQLIALSENGIDRTMAVKIAEAFEKHGEKGEALWFAKGAMWGDSSEFKAMKNAVSREMDLVVITPGQDKPLFMSNSFMSVLTQFKTFAVSANHRILLSGIQKADADQLASVVIAVALGAVVSNIKAWQNNKPQKEGVALLQDAVDKSGVAGWLFEGNAFLESAGIGLSNVTGSLPSRFQGRSKLLGMFGPSVDSLKTIQELSLAARRSVGEDGEPMRRTDIDKMMRLIPGQNLMWMMPITNEVEEGLAKLFGVKP